LCNPFSGRDYLFKAKTIFTASQLDRGSIHAHLVASAARNGVEPRTGNAWRTIMLARTKVAIAAAVVLASASGALAQNFNGNGIPNDVDSNYRSQGYNTDAYWPQADDTVVTHGSRHHRHQR
jgi:hypothetical protein